jgi:opacity protein-like surface antigen
VRAAILHALAPLAVLLALLAPLPAAGGTGEASGQDGSLEYLTPGMSAGVFQLDPGPRQFAHRLCFSPAVGWLGGQQIFGVRVAYNPNSWLGYEGSLAHNPGSSVQALFHTLSAIVRYPVPGRFQPYGAAGFGLILVFPGEALNADSATELAFSAGGGLEFYLRDDVALRADLRAVTILGNQPSQVGSAAYSYREATLGFAFYRTLGR